MDWGSHVVLATKLLDCCDLDKGAAIYSVIPVIDKEPAHFHRVYAHILENQPDFLDIAVEIFGSEEVKERKYDALKLKIGEKTEKLQSQMASLPDDDYKKKRMLEKRIYAYTRIAEDTPVFMKHAEDACELVGDEQVMKISGDKLSAAVSLLSHTYFDTWNNPIQLFLPECSNCSAQWSFWDAIDYMKFRGDFYKSENIIKFRREIVKADIWNTKIKPEALIKALIIRLGEMGQPAIPYEIVDMGIRDFMRYMDINEYQRADKELQFCNSIEDKIKEIILKEYSRA